MATPTQQTAPPTAPDASGRAGEGPPLPRSALTPVSDRVAAFARVGPARAAVQSGTESITYRELHAWAADIAARLSEAGVGRGDRVAVLVEPSVSMVAAVLGVTRSGAAYVPLDVSHPGRRLDAVLDDAGVRAAVVTDATAGRLTGRGVPLVRAEHRRAPSREAAADATAVEGTGDRADLEGEHHDDAPAVPVNASDPAYVVYTSGTTGEPKGVVVEQGQLAASTTARRMVYPGEPVFLLVSPLAFDSSVAGLWGTLTAGGRLIVAAPDEIRDPERLVELVAEHGVTHLLCVPSLYRVLLDAAARLGNDRLRSLDTVIVAGEPLPQTLVTDHFARRSAPTTLTNEYGPTEATVWASYHRFEAPEPVTIGTPVPGSRLYVLDPELRPVPRGIEGELYIGGAGVSRGYLGRPEETARSFLDDPFADAAGARMYRTGDLVRWNPDGLLEFLGRRDGQVKIRGHRVEPTAVEAHLCALPDVREAAVVVDGTGDALVGFVLGPAAPAAGTLRELLTDRLPAAMVPARIVVLDDFPRTVNGKTDRRALRARAAEVPDAAPATAGSEGAGEADLTARVAAAWAEVLKTSTVPTDVNFFDLGGHSLAMFQLREALERHTGQCPPVVALFRHTTVAAQTAMLQEHSDVPEGADGAEPRTPHARREAARRARTLRARRRATGQEVAR
jgi:amino acid adenylation domain-containing protein